MAWDKDVPAGNTKISVGDDGLRANNAALETAFDLEHEFSTGGVNSGRHHFTVDSSANILALSHPQTGSIALDTAPRPTACLSYYNGSAWVYADIGTADIARLDEVNVYTATSTSASIWTSVAPSGGNLAINLQASPMKYATITGNTTVSNPTNPLGGYGQQVALQITMGGSGPHTISWGSSYRSAYGIAPAYDDTDGAINLFFLTVLQPGTVLVTAAPHIGSF